MSQQHEESCGFTLAHYRTTLRSALDKGYAFFPLKDHFQAKTQERTILMRHDIDFDLNPAIRIARIEGELGIKSSFFLRPDGAYNLFSHDNYQIVRELLEMNHEIGLHFCPSFASAFNEDWQNVFDRQRRYLEAVLGEKIAGFSLHEPTRMGQGGIQDQNLIDLGIDYHAYQKMFVGERKYISDSSATWREGCMCEHITRGVPNLTILTHPFWWFEKTPLENY